VRAIVTHGGWGTVGRALRHGVPALIVPLFGDQPSIAAQAVAAGLAHSLRRRDATPAGLRAAVGALLADTELAARVRRAAAELAALRADHTGVRALEALVSARSNAPR
jgi:UDP:flavonoid glycosyltransferase YjiC (YdhE family)